MSNERVDRPISPLVRIQSGVDEYKTSLGDEDKQVLVLNNQIVLVEKRTISAGSLEALIGLGSWQRSEIIQYRPDVIVGLSDENLIAAARGLSGEVLDTEDPVVKIQSLRDRLKRAGQRSRERSNTQEVTKPNSLESIFKANIGETPEQEKDDFQKEVFGELVERIIEKDADPRQQQWLITELNDNWTPQMLLDMLEKTPEAFAQLAGCLYLFDNNLQRAINQVLDQQLGILDQDADSPDNEVAGEDKEY